MDCSKPLAALPEGLAGRLIPFLFSLAPDGVCQAAASLRRWWSLAPPFQLCVRRTGVAFSFLWHFPWDHSPSPLASIAPSGARTFLPSPPWRAAAITWLTPLILYHTGSEFTSIFWPPQVVCRSTQIEGCLSVPRVSDWRHAGICRRLRTLPRAYWDLFLC